MLLQKKHMTLQFRKKKTLIASQCQLGDVLPLYLYQCKKTEHSSYKYHTLKTLLKMILILCQYPLIV